MSEDAEEAMRLELLQVQQLCFCLKIEGNRKKTGG